MKLVKALGLAALLALATMAFVGVSSASAVTYIQSCMTKSGSECKPASIGTTLVVKGKTTFKNAVFNNTCEGQLKGEVIDNEAAGEGESVEEEAVSELTPGEFVNCSQVQLLVLTVWVQLFSLFHWDNYGLYVTEGIQQMILHSGLIGDCVFDEQEDFEAEWINGSPSKFVMSGTMKKVEGSPFCGSTGEMSGTFEVTSVTDKSLAEAGNIKFE